MKTTVQHDGKSGAERAWVPHAQVCSVSELAISATEQEELGFQRPTTVGKVPHDLREALDLISCEIQSSDTEKAAQAEV